MEDLKDTFYIGDGAYVKHDGFSVMLLAPRQRAGETVIHYVALDPQVFLNFLDWVNAEERKHGKPGFWIGKYSEHSAEQE